MIFLRRIKNIDEERLKYVIKSVIFLVLKMTMDNESDENESGNNEEKVLKVRRRGMKLRFEESSEKHE